MVMKIRTSSDNLEVDYSLSKLLEQDNGLEKIAQEKLPPFIRETRDYEAFARKILFVHTITESDCVLLNNEPHVYYPKDLDSHASFFANDGEVPQYAVEGDGVYVGIFNIVSDDITINIKRLMVQKYNYLERVRELAGQKIGELEDSRLMSLTDALVAANPDDQLYEEETVDELSKAVLVAGKKLISQHDLPLASYVMNPVRLDDILLWGTDEIDQLTQREILETGVKYTIWGSVKLITSRSVDVDIIYCYADKEFVGRMPILQDLTVKLTETANKLEKGLFMFEFVGMYLATHKGVGKIVFK